MSESPVMNKEQSSSLTLRLGISAFFLIVGIFLSSCSLIKTKDYYISSGKRYAAKGELREAAIQYSKCGEARPAICAGSPSA